jgi:hypothetical protein
LTPDQIRAFVIADNRLAELAGWDDSILAIELQHLLTIDNNFDVTLSHTTQTVERSEIVNGFEPRACTPAALVTSWSVMTPELLLGVLGDPPRPV